MSRTASVAACSLLGGTSVAETFDRIARYLELFGVRPTDHSLAALESAPALRTVRVSKYPKAEVSRYQSATGIADSFAPEPGDLEWY